MKLSIPACTSSCMNFELLIGDKTKLIVSVLELAGDAAREFGGIEQAPQQDVRIVSRAGGSPVTLLCGWCDDVARDPARPGE
jgi:hypothetical protein